ncbi:alpha/beta hydrolase [Carnobacterium maltaromaticum]|uniref:alpha/beta hydrolase n=1 Tax=Carnobacterium maltaromaticum TaxID=2751 RepID=UPI000C78C807|nr:alpha/beta hydrolase [Carnobacterium maltaromaticum]PLS33785.1 alpha/beta hydrolase [Carnobacterium maltaromaticum]PLS35767.1 alpha/beta hydrolase [Carnobacterium maltaromaticum]PLS36216.1 alpha/beta hydrolase [Carnobacterium maltaromaticum]PLS42673.1 alpha/beta hydrolase [Carnobacterium maltaromaticum]PLS42908.1 alpha/beta hydrolase [Carnobacterium maltaromaticum]
MKKKIIIGLSSLTTITVLGLAGAGLYFYDVAVAINKKDFLESNDKKVDKKDPWAAEKKWYTEADREEIKLTSTDGLVLSSIYIAAEKPSNKVVILAHGYSGNLEEMAPYAKLYHDMGFNILAPDARGHGSSEGNYIGFGWPERKDYQQWIQVMIDKVGSDTEIALHGVSMGAATVMMTSGEKLPKNVKVIVEDCGYSSVTDELNVQLKKLYNLPSFPLVPITSVVTKIRAGYSFEEASAVEQVKKNKVPMLFIHGDQDSFVPTEMVYKVYEANASEKELYIAPNSEHAKAYEKNKVEYSQKVQDFVGKYISN